MQSNSNSSQIDNYKMAAILGFLHNFISLGYDFGMKNEIEEERRKKRNNVNGYKVVAAGNPAMAGHKKKDVPMVPESLPFNNEEIQTGDYEKYIVDGYSMFLEGIDNSDVLLCQPMNNEELNEIGFGQYVIIQVDRDYYKAKKRNLEFDSKLRKTLLRVPVGMTDDGILEGLKAIDNSALLPQNQKQLRQKYAEIKSYYKNRELMLSKTYREGNLRYSFHPVDLIVSKVEYVVRQNGDAWDIKRV